MRNRFLKSLFAASAACFLLLMSGCNSAEMWGFEFRGEACFDLGAELEMGDFILKGEEPSCVREGDYFSLEVPLQITNKKQKAVSYHFKDSILKDETQGDEYKVTIQNDKLTVDPWTAGHVSFSSAIPSSITAHSYKLSFEMDIDSDRFHFVYYLHKGGATRIMCNGGTPCDEGSLKVNYYVSGTLVKTVDYEHEQPWCFNPNYVYESSDHLWYCDEWYTNEEKTERVTYIDSNLLNLYGDASPCFCWDLVSNPNYSTLTKVNHAPLNEKLVIPRYYENKEIIIGNSTLCNLYVLDVYIPINVRRIENHNFEGLRGQVYRSWVNIWYEGSEEEWNSICSSEIDNGHYLILKFMNHSDYPY